MIDSKLIMQLRAQTGAGVLEAKQALEQTGGDLATAQQYLRKTGALKAAKKNAREAREGVVHAYVHSGAKVGVLVELLCETDFVARNPEFVDLAHELALQVAATAPLYVQPEDIPAEVLEKEKKFYEEEVAQAGKPAELVEKIVAGKLEKWFAEVCLLSQPFIKEEGMTIAELLHAKIVKLGENIKVRRFVRLALGE